MNNMAQFIGKYAERTCVRLHFTSGLPYTLAVRTTTLRPANQKSQQLHTQRGNTGGEVGQPMKGKMYILPMFPYPSGDLHLGHMRVYTISDVLSRFRRMQGYEVIHPIAWDAFGLPAENAAIERGIDPAVWTERNIQKMKGQLQAMNCHWDWDREFRTCDPRFYKHTQRLFLLLHQRGLAYQAESLVNYDPVDKTVLANEQVDSNGLSWRSGAKVEKRMLKQWFLKISEFREDLLQDLDSLEGAWPERVLTMQKNWLGKSAGARVKFSVIAYDQSAHSDIEVFTTRLDTLFGVQYIALAATHPIVQELVKEDIKLKAFLDKMPSLPPDSKVGYMLPHIRAINPLAYEESTPDATKASLPIYVTPYVLGDYGDGAVMGVPGHDTRDYAFWKHNNYDQPIRVVVAQSASESTGAVKDDPFIHPGHLTSRSGPYAGQTSAEATSKIIELLESKRLGSAAETWRLRDWLISRQRYWGTPIPIVHCDSCGPVPVPEDQLPVELPSVKSHWLKGKAGNPLEDSHDWINTPCPKCYRTAKRDTDTMDTFVDSSWYFMRFVDPQNEDQLFNSNVADNILPVDLYVGGVEHAILHLLYARFISKFVAATSLWTSKNNGEPFKQLLAQGMVHGKTYSDPSNGRFLKPDEVDLSVPSNPIVVATGEAANVSFEKMSKSKYNGVDPTICMNKHGADATRAHILFQAPVSEILDWDEEKIAGITRWFQRIHDLIERINAQFNTPRHIKPQVHRPESMASREDFKPELYFQAWGEQSKANKSLNPAVFELEKRLWRVVQSSITSITESYSSTYSLNTVVSDLMALTKQIAEFVNLDEIDGVLAIRTKEQILLLRCAAMTLVQMLAPIAPAFAEECWSLLNPPPGSISESSPSKVLLRSNPANVTTSVFDHPFPLPDGTLDLLAPKSQPCAVQVNGKLKVVVHIPIPNVQLSGKELEKWIIQQIVEREEWKSSAVCGKIDASKAKKVIVVRGGKTVNIVI